MEFRLPSHQPLVSRSQSNHHKRQCRNGVSFAESLLRCGFYQDTTLTSATRQQSRDQRVMKRKKTSMDHLSLEFAKEAQKVRQLQSQLALRQHEMALIAYELYSATFIQSVYRGWKARMIFKKLFLKRFLQIFLMFRHRWRKIRRAQIRISRFYRHLIQIRKFRQVMRTCCATIKVQRMFRYFFYQKRAIIRTVSYRLWNHIQLFAITKAKKVIQPLERYRYVLNAFIGEYMRRKRLLRLGNKLACFRIFYSLFHLEVHPQSPLLLPSENDDPNFYANDFESSDPNKISSEQIAEREFRHTTNLIEQSKNELLSFLKRKDFSPHHPHHKFLPDLLSREIKMNPNKKFQSILDPISLIHNEITYYNRPVPTPFILSGNTNRLRSLRETVLFLMDLKQKAHQYPEALESPPPLTYAPNTPRMKRAMSESLARKFILDAKLIPPSMRPFAAELILPESLAKKEADKLTGLRKIHHLRNLRSNSSGQSSLLPKPPVAPPKNLPSSPLLTTRRKPSRPSGEFALTAPVIPSQQLSESSLFKSDLLSSQEMISAPQTAEISNHPSTSNFESLSDAPPAPQSSSSETESEDSHSEYSQDEDFEEEESEISPESLMPLRPSQPPPSFFKRRQNIALHSIVPLLNISNYGKD